VTEFGPDFPVLSFGFGSFFGDAFSLLSWQSKKVKLESTACKRWSIFQDFVCG
jgi:hypothetical protein